MSRLPRPITNYHGDNSKIPFYLTADDAPLAILDGQLDVWRPATCQAAVQSRCLSIIQNIYVCCLY
ncbi:hypothetical protein Hlac_2237 [Halorubrum lacusprofundi ATCC 49239]|jgi:hypothetical protein|uniref:Uncharacterized protein n=1 Tax=Halorubrum lacusprofundi (strain ATCC 49239 / DSM 5036 / JCM 8891 / ACAM 34) TaxID=416348 RepID=B9LRU0_HALLT|nr:hypothetical protein Hlac_2237 [Halorubrum lacusprofundi ATCC 49239]